MQAAAGPVLSPDSHWQALDIPLRAPVTVARVLEGPSRACSVPDHDLGVELGPLRGYVRSYLVRSLAMATLLHT